MRPILAVDVMVRAMEREAVYQVEAVEQVGAFKKSDVTGMSQNFIVSLVFFLLFPLRLFPSLSIFLISFPLSRHHETYVRHPSPLHTANGPAQRWVSRLS